MLLLLGAATVYWRLSQPAGQAQLGAYRVGNAADEAAAQRELRLLEAQGDSATARAELCASWGTGNPRFDYYLARYLFTPDCSDALRERFTQELARRPELLPRFAHFWRWRAGAIAADEAAAQWEFFELRRTERPGTRLTWREVLDLTALLELCGQGKSARRLKPDDWESRLAGLHVAADAWRALAEQPAGPLPGWSHATPR